MTTGSSNTILGRYNGNQDYLDIRTASNRVVISDGAGTVRYYINAHGEHCIGMVPASAASWTGFSSDPLHSVGNVGRGSLASTAEARLVIQDRTDKFISFVNASPVHYGSISRSGSGISYGSNSDYRLKENITDLTGAITRVKSLSPKRFNFISDTTDTLQDGFLAHEVQTVVPEAVIGEHDGTLTTGNVEDANGNVVKENVHADVELAEGETFVEVKTEPEYQQLDPAKLVPLLTAALQEAITKIETLEAKVTALENA